MCYIVRVGDTELLQTEFKTQHLIVSSLNTVCLSLSIETAFRWHIRRWLVIDLTTPRVTSTDDHCVALWWHHISGTQTEEEQLHPLCGERLVLQQDNTPQRRRVSLRSKKTKECWPLLTFLQRHNILITLEQTSLENHWWYVLEWKVLFPHCHHYYFMSYTVHFFSFTSIHCYNIACC